MRFQQLFIKVFLKYCLSEKHTTWKQKYDLIVAEHKQSSKEKIV